MLFTTLLTTFFVSLPSALSVPISNLNDPDYMCGFVLTAPNENAFLSLHYTGGCLGFFNATNYGHQDAYAYKLFDGCKCAFFTYVFSSFARMAH